MGIGRDFVEIAALLITVAFAALLITRSDGTVAVVNAAGGMFNQALRIVSGQDSGFSG